MFKMYCVHLLILYVLIQSCSCTVDDIFDEWAKKKEEPHRGYGPYKFVLLHLASCDTNHKKDTNLWMNPTIVIEKYNDTFNVIVDLSYPVNIDNVKLHYELWIKIDKKIRLLTSTTVNNPCKNVLTSFLFLKIKTAPPCTILKGEYHFVLEDVDKIAHKMIRNHPYTRIYGKAEFFSDKGVISCQEGVGDVEKRA